ncbi:LPXTG cell wall anchor domain-containing protein [Candidatus Saccharibacteria bacterium]|nr:LPXTG cell wall anchor domain-containing protein [Candidatus Saccharibacteria bacterium]
MGVIVHKETEKRTELNDRIAADLRNRAEMSEQDDPDLVEDMDYVKNLKKTGKFSWFWFVLVGLALASLVLIIVI